MAEYGDQRYRENYSGGQAGGYTDDFSAAVSHADEHSGSSGDRGMFENVIGMLGNNHQQYASGDVDEQGAVHAHQQFFGGGGTSQADSGSMGSAAAMQALKMFTSGQSGGSSGGGGQNAFIGMAMGQAATLFEQQAAQGNVADGETKESAVQKAAEMAFKMYMKNQMTGGSSGSMSGLMGMASKFLS